MLNKVPRVRCTCRDLPHPPLRGPAQTILGATERISADYFQTCHRNLDSFSGLLNSVRSTIVSGLPLETTKINAREVVHGLNFQHSVGDVLTDLPSYQWNHSIGFWSESRMSRNVRFRRFPRHGLLGPRYVDDIPTRPSCRHHLKLKEAPWLQELKV